MVQSWVLAASSAASDHAPVGPLEGTLVALAAAAVLWAVYAAVRYTVRPGEEDPQHMKRRILCDEDGEEP
jgi:hypothetical protein